jgi:hypothetical protein
MEELVAELSSAFILAGIELKATAARRLDCLYREVG